MIEETGHPKLTDGEWAIMRVIWREEPCAAGSVKEILEPIKDWSYSTVKTLMDRMVNKGLLKTERIRNLILYRSCISATEAQDRELTHTLRRAFDGALTPMIQFLFEQERLSQEEIEELHRLIDQHETGNRPETES
ncbi:MAG: BlaI/MecI/CopY family transcriptional regulator [bacterium]